MRIRIVSVLVCCSLLAWLPAGEPTNLEALGRDLASPSFQVREKASKALWELGRKARPTLEAVASGDDAEARERAEAILEKFDWGIFPDTPASITKQIEELRRGNASEQQAAIEELLKLGSDGIAAVRIALQHDFPNNERDNIASQIQVSLSRLVPEAFLANDLARVESLLLLNAMGTEETAALDYALFASQWGKPADSVKTLEAIRKRGGHAAKTTTSALAILNHFTGNHEECRKVIAEYTKSNQESLLEESLLEDQGAWETLTTFNHPGREAPFSTALALFRERKAGHADKAAEIFTELLKPAVPDSAVDNSLQWRAISISLNGKPREAMEWMTPLTGSSRAILADMLLARMQFEQVLKITEPAEALPAAGQPPVPGRISTSRIIGQLHVRRGRVLSQLGRTTEAESAFKAAMKRVANDRNLARELLRVEVRVGRMDLALQHAAEYLELEETRRRGGRNDYSPTFRPSPFEILFEDEGDAAQGWWTALKQTTPRPSNADIMRLISRLLTGKATPEEIEFANKAMNIYRHPLDPSHDFDPQSGMLLQPARALAAMHRAHGRLDLAEKELRAAIATVGTNDAPIASYEAPRAWMFGTNEGYRAWIDLGDLLLDQGRPHSAAEIYFQGWERYPDSAVPLYHSGRALIVAGKVADGEHRIAVAHRLSLGNARNRGRFLEELCNRGRLKDLRTERDLVLKSVWRFDSYHGNVWSQTSRASALLKDYDTAADTVDLYCNFIFKSSGFTFIDGRSYLDMPTLVPVNRALSLAKAGKIDEAMMLAREVLITVPGHAVLTTTMVPLLDQTGFGKEAEEIFQSSWQAYRKMIIDYPQSAWAHGWSAHLSANCQRELDRALADAKRGVELDSDSKWNREVLAETHFRRGETAEAVAIMKQLAKETPRNHFYRRQLIRFAIGDRNTPQPVGPVE